MRFGRREYGRGSVWSRLIGSVPERCPHGHTGVAHVDPWRDRLVGDGGGGGPVRGPLVGGVADERGYCLRWLGSTIDCWVSTTLIRRANTTHPRDQKERMPCLDTQPRHYSHSQASWGSP
jgi:hypothetical protein